MKIEEATLQFIRDDKGKRWFVQGEDQDYIPFMAGDAEQIYYDLVRCGHIAPDPLQTALDAVDNMDDWSTKAYVKTVIRNLAKELIE